MCIVVVVFALLLSIAALAAGRSSPALLLSTLLPHAQTAHRTRLLLRLFPGNRVITHSPQKEDSRPIPISCTYSANNITHKGGCSAVQLDAAACRDRKTGSV